MKKNNANTNKLMNNPLLLKEIFLRDGVVELGTGFNADSPNRFSVKETSLTFPVTEYYTTVSLAFCLSFLMPNFTKQEINQIVSMFEFHHNLFCKPISKVQLHHFLITKNHVTYSSEAIYIQISKSSFDIYQNCSFFEDEYTLKKLSIENFQKIITKQLKKSLSLYFNEKIVHINNEMINKVLNETLEDYNHRINHQDFFKPWTDDEFYENLKTSNINYTLVNRDNNPNIYSKNEHFKNNELILLKHDEDEDVEDLTDIRSRITMFMNINNTKIIKKILTPIFKEKDLSYILSILSLLNFIDKMNNPYSTEIILTIEKEPSRQYEKVDAFDANYNVNISFDDFCFDIGRETELRSYSIYEYHYKSDKFKMIYKNLVNFVKKSLSQSLETDVKDLTIQHIRLQQMKNA